MNPPIYLDYMATTPLAPEVRTQMLPWLGERVGNASSSTHVFGWEASEAVENSRLELAGLLGISRMAEIVFTSGATESNNMMIRGIVEANAGGRGQVVTTAIEHPSVLAPCRSLCRDGVGLAVVLPGSEGVIDPDAVKAEIGTETKLISMMAANNETGALQPVAEVAAIAREHGVPLHVDASQAVGKIDFDVDELDIDFLSVSGHKFHGPMGIGALYVRRSAASRALPPLLLGGGQERGRRPGTLPVAQIVGLGAAAKLARENREADAAHTTKLRSILWDRLCAGLDDLALNGPQKDRLPGCLNFSPAGTLADAVIAQAPGIGISSGSACSSGRGGGSHVLRAMGLSAARRGAALRISFGRYTTTVEIERAATALTAAIETLRAGVELSPSVTGAA